MQNQRIHVVGTSGSGKTTLAQQISQRLHMAHIELDALHWDANWAGAPDAVFRDRVEQALTGDRWVIDGNYSRVRDIVWSRADTVVWLNYSLWIVFSRIVQRTLWRSISQQELWNGNRESFAQALGKESMILWTLQTYDKNRRKYADLFQQPNVQHLEFVELRSPQEAKAWLQQL